MSDSLKQLQQELQKDLYEHAKVLNAHKDLLFELGDRAGRIARLIETSNLQSDNIDVGESKPISLPQVSKGPTIQGFGCDQAFARDLKKGTRQFYVTSLADSGAGTLREAMEATGGRKYIIVLVSGTIDLRSTIAARGKFALLGQAGRLVVRTLPGVKGTTIALYDSEQLMQHMVLACGQATFKGEAARRVVTSYNSGFVIDHCSLLFGVDDGWNAWKANNNVGNTGTVSNCVIALNLQHSHEDPKVTSGKGALIGDGAFDISFHHNALYSGIYRSPQMSGYFADIRNNWVSSYRRGLYVNSRDQYGYAVQANVVGNVFDTTEENYQAQKNYTLLLAGTSNHKASAYVAANGIDTGKGLRLLSPTVRDTAERLSNEITVSPVTGKPVPKVVTHKIQGLKGYIAENAGAHNAERDNVTRDVIRRMEERVMAFFDGVDGDPRYPNRRKVDNYARRLYTAPGQKTGWPLTGSGPKVNPAFDPKYVNWVPDSYREEIGLKPGTDLTMTDVHGDGVPDLERYLEKVTGYAPY